MTVIVAKDYEDMSSRAADIIATTVNEKPDCLLGLATGSTPLGTYEHLIGLYRSGLLDFSSVTTVNLDEYRGLSPQDPQSYRYFMEQNLFRHINITSSHTHVPDGMNPDAKQVCADYNALLHRLGSVDLQLLGLGQNGHIGFNEPGSDADAETHCVDLTQSTIQANKRFFTSEADVPTQAYTMGLRSILSAKRILLIVSGAGKAEIVARAFSGPVTTDVPASLLQNHPGFLLLGDEAALSLLMKTVPVTVR